MYDVAVMALKSQLCQSHMRIWAKPPMMLVSDVGGKVRVEYLMLTEDVGTSSAPNGSAMMGW